MSRHRARVVDFGHRKIHAIKLVRELSRTGLREAKEIVERGGSFDFELNPGAQAAIDEAARAGIHLDCDPPLGGAAAPSSLEPATRGSVMLRYICGPRKINAIKLTREISGVGLKQAKDIVEQSRVIPRALSASEAEALAARFEAFGSRVEIQGAGTPPTAARAPATSASNWDEDDDDF